MSPIVDIIAGAALGLVRGISDLETREQVTAKILEGLKPSPPANVAADYAEERAKVLGKKPSK